MLVRRDDKRGAERGDPRSGWRECDCKYKLVRDSHQTKLVFDCRASGGPASLKDRSCRAHALRTLRDELNVDAIVLSSYSEVQYAGEPLEMLREINGLAIDLEQFGLRDPMSLYFENNSSLSSSQLARQRSKCDSCRFNPSKVYSGLEEEIYDNLVKFCTSLQRTVRSFLKAKLPRECNQCLDDSVSDLAYIHERLESLMSRILYEGFRIVDGGGKDRVWQEHPSSRESQSRR